MMFFNPRISILLLMAILAGCARRPIKPALPLEPTVAIETLSSSVALSIMSGGKVLSGRGYLVMRPPDQFRLMLLSPFGTTVAEIFLFGDQMLYIDSTKDRAYRGAIEDLPDIPTLQGWRLLRWTTERVMPEVPGQELLVRVRANGEQEIVTFDRQGFLLQKQSGGDTVRYEGYHSVDGVPVPTAIHLTDRHGNILRIVLEEPEANVPLDEKVFIPSLEGVTVFPFSLFPHS